MTSLLTSDGAQELLQVFGIVPVRSTAGTDLQRIVWPVFCEKLTQDNRTDHHHNSSLLLLYQHTDTHHPVD